MGKCSFLKINLGMIPLKLIGKTSPVLRISTHIHGDSKEIGGKYSFFT